MSTCQVLPPFHEIIYAVYKESTSLFSPAYFRFFSFQFSSVHFISNKFISVQNFYFIIITIVRLGSAHFNSVQFNCFMSKRTGPTYSRVQVEREFDNKANVNELGNLNNQMK